MQLNFKKYKLGMALSFQNGKSIAADTTGEFPVYGSNGEIGKCKHHKHKNALIIGRVGAYCGSVIHEQQKFWASDNAIVAKQLGDFDIRFLFYYLQAFPLNLYAGGAAQPLLNQTILSQIDCLFPTPTYQQQIAQILTAYDDLIETNNQRIATLEQLAQQIYKEWFVRLRFPNWENTPLHHGIPEGWERKKIGDVSSLVSRGITPIYDENGHSVVINQKCIRDGKLNLIPSQRQSKEIPENKQIQQNDVLINSTGEGTLGRVARVTRGYENHTVDTHVTIARPDSEKINACYYGMTLLNYQSIFEFMAIGATGQTELGRKDIIKLEIEVPTDELQSKFDALVTPMMEQVDILNEQNEHLTKTRNLLLPRLISGKLSVK
jgi:type I restriction enzyme S subunit